MDDKAYKGGGKYVDVRTETGLEKTHFILTVRQKWGVYHLSDDKVILIDIGNDKEAGKKVLKILNENNWTLEAVYDTLPSKKHS